jgi:hypothetical protein
LTWGKLPDDMDLYLHAPDGTNKDPNKVSLPTDKTGRCVVMFQVRIYILVIFLIKKNKDPSNTTGRWPLCCHVSGAHIHPNSIIGKKNKKK